MSAGITAASLELQGSPETQARYLKCFRADSIIRDSEAIRQALMSHGNHMDTRWSILGQSFGGFCCTTYLSMAPESLAEVLITGGLPPGICSPCSAEDVYNRTFRRVLKQNDKFYARFPMAEARARRIVLHCLGFAHGLERLNYCLEFALDPGTGTFSQRFLKEFDTIMAWDTNPIYALLHEAIYCQGEPSRWAAHRVRETHYGDAFDAVAAANNGKPVMFTGEMVFPWMFDEFKELRRVKETAELIAADPNWPALYDENRLQSNNVAVAAATYFEDMFVDFDLAQETAHRIRGLRQHVTSEFLHDGLKENGAVLFEKLLNMARGGNLLR